MKMTQFETLSSMEDSSTSGSSSSNTIRTTYTASSRPNSSEHRHSKIPSPKAADNRPNHRLNKVAVGNNRKGKIAPPSSINLKEIRFYRNGDIHQEEQVVSFDLSTIHDWHDCLESINRKVNYPGTIQVLYTLKGKKLSCVADLENETDIVVSGKSPFRLLAYGPSPASPNHIRTPVCRPSSGRRSVRAAFTKSVIIEPTSVGDIDCLDTPLIKTVSEHNVSGSGGNKPSPLVRAEYRKLVNHSKGRPLSCYNSPDLSYGSSTPVSGGKSTKCGVGSSRIPKRILSCSPATPIASPIMTQSTPLTVIQSPRAQRNAVTSSNRGARASSKDRTPKQDVTRKEFIRPRRVKLIVKGTKPRKATRFLLNKKTAVAFDQVLSAITESIKPEWGAVRKVYTLDGEEVSTLEGFFGDEDTFLLCPNDRVSGEELMLDPEECKVLKVPYEPTRRTKAALKPQIRRPNSTHLSSSQASTRSTARNYPTHPRFIPVTDYPPEVKERFTIENEIGDGNFAVVRLVVDKKNGNKFALKVIDKLQTNHDSPPDNEVVILSKLTHPNIILVFEKIAYRNNLYVVMELIPSGDLFDLIARATKFCEKESASMTKDITSALAYLHSRKIVHRDIKPENLLVSLEDGQRRIKLGDFGLAQQIKGPLFTVCGTPTYVSPEILAETGYGRPVDIWATGVIVYILLCGYPPFVSPTGEQEDLFDLILTGDFEFPPEHWDLISNDAKHLIVQMLEVDPELRLDAESVLEHPWLAVNSAEGEKRRNRQCRKNDFQFSVFEQMGLSKLHFPSSIYSPSQPSDDQDASL